MFKVLDSVGRSRRAKPPENTAATCLACDRPPQPLSRFCEAHQDQAVIQRKKFRVRRLDVLLILCLALLIWAYPRITRTLRGTSGDDPSLFSLANDFIALFLPDRYRTARDTPGVVETIRTALRSGGSIPPELEDLLRQDEQAGGTLSLDDVIDRVEAIPGARLNAAQQARLRALKKGKGGSAPAAAGGEPGTLPATADATAAVRSAGAALATCGNGVVEPGEQCDGQALAGATCASLGFSGDCGQDEACLHSGLTCLGNCTFDYTGCTAESQAAVQRFVDNGNGTASDRLAGLTWELKCRDADCADRHSVLATLPWQAAAAEWVSRLNAERFAGHDDWRLPTLEELRTLLAAVPPCAAEPCPTAAWPRTQTAPAGYWSSTTFSVDKGRAWAVSFRDGDVYTAAKGDALHVRAVRKGS